MIQLLLSRTMQNDDCTLGRLTVGPRSWFTIERPWVADPAGGIAGQPGHSCIAAGTYRIERHESEAHPRSWALSAPLLGVWHWPWDIPKGVISGRSTVLIHSANYAHELEGCIAPGKTQAKGDGGQWGVFSSRDAMNEVNQVLNGQLDISIIISNDFNSGAAA